MGRPGWGLIVPVFVYHLETDHFVIIVEESLCVKVPDPELLAMVAAPRC